MSLAALPHRVVDLVAERLPVLGRVRTEEAADHRRQAGDPPQLGGARVDVLLGQHRNAVEPAGCPRAVVRQPVVVGATALHRIVDVGVGLDREHLRGVQHRHIDAVVVHALDAELRVPAPTRDLAVGVHAFERALLLFVGVAGDAGQRENVGGEPVAVGHHPLLALVVGLDVPDPVAEGFGREFLQTGRRLEGVAIGVDEAVPGLGGRGSRHGGVPLVGVASAVTYAAPQRESPVSATA